MPHHILVLSCNTWFHTLKEQCRCYRYFKLFDVEGGPPIIQYFKKMEDLKPKGAILYVSILQMHGSTVLCCVSHDSGQLVLGPGTTATLKRDLTKKSFFGMLVKVNASFPLEHAHCNAPYTYTRTLNKAVPKTVHRSHEQISLNTRAHRSKRWRQNTSKERNSRKSNTK